MGFRSLDLYNEGQLPIPDYYVNDYTNCPNAMSYKPIDVSGLQADVDAQFTALTTEAEQEIEGITTGLNTLDDDWGAKYISINNKGIDIVRVDTFTPMLTDIQKEIEEQHEKCSKVISQIVSGTAEVEAYLSAIDAHYQTYLQVKQEKEQTDNNLSNARRSLSYEQQKEQPSSSRISELQTDINYYEGQSNKLGEEIHKYEGNKINEPEGQWVLA